MHKLLSIKYMAEYRYRIFLRARMLMLIYPPLPSLFTCSKACLPYSSYKTRSEGMYLRLFIKSIIRVAKFDSKVGSRRTTRIRDLVVLTVLLVALILFSYHM